MVAGRQHIDERGLPSAGSGGGVNDDRLAGLEDGPDAGKDIQTKLAEFRSAMVYGWLGNCCQNGERGIGRPRNLQKVAARLAWHLKTRWHFIHSSGRARALKASLPARSVDDVRVLAKDATCVVIKRCGNCALLQPVVMSFFCKSGINRL